MRGRGKARKPRNRRNPTTIRDPRVDARGRADVRTSFARFLVTSAGSEHGEDAAVVGGLVALLRTLSGAFRRRSR